MLKLLGSIVVFIIGVLMATSAYHSSSISTCSLDISLETYQCLQKLSIVFGIFSFAVMLIGIILIMKNFKALTKRE